jgi:hypothetical protein
VCAEDTVLGEQMTAEGACKRHHAGKPTAVAKCLDLAHCCRTSDGQQRDASLARRGGIGGLASTAESYSPRAYPSHREPQETLVCRRGITQQAKHRRVTRQYQQRV